MTVTSGSAHLPLDLTGPGPDEPARVDVLLLHSGVGDRREWGPLLEALPDDVRAASYDARGFGASSYLAEPFSRSADAVAALDAAGMDRAVLIGCSRGAQTAIEVALEQPQRVAGLVLLGAPMDGAPQAQDDPAEVVAAYTVVKDAEEAGDLDAVNRAEARFWLDGVPADEGRVGGAVRRLFLEMNGAALTRPPAGDEHEVATWARLEEIAVPTLLLVGDLDLAEIRDSNRLAASRISGARFVPLPGVAHLPVLEADPACLSAICQFLEELAPA